MTWFLLETNNKHSSPDEEVGDPIEASKMDSHFDIV